MNRILLLALALLGLTATANAQTKEACLASFQSGNVHWYYPTVKTDSVKRVPDGKDSVRAPLPHDGCVHMRTVIGYRYVAIKGGTMMRWYRHSDGSMILYAHDACGNKADDVVYPEPAPAKVEQVRGERGATGPQGLQGPAGRDGRNGTNGRDGHDGRDAKGPSTWKTVGIAVGSAIVVGALGCVTHVIHCGHHTSGPPTVHTDSVITKPTGPGVTTDSSRVGPGTTNPGGPGVNTDSSTTWDGRCQSNDARLCPQGMRRGTTSTIAAMRSRPGVGLIIDPRNKRIGVNVNIPFTFRM